ncbi:phage tail spike protein [Trichococcus flocculiformis]|uniref:phage tail spike protein n=1 Tax=Trichococcus flocculiformis TaxID=82803 RepID=UPI002AAACA0C|nr:phage tail spike protein [Trichococcus flocculiformis]
MPGSGSWSIKEVKNARDALGGVEGSFLDTYGGEYMFDNYDIRLYANRGKQSGALIAYGRNLTDLEQEENIAETYTSIYPNAVVTDDNQNEIIQTLPEYYLDSEYVSNYARRKILTVDFSGNDVTTVEQLRAKAEAYIINNRIGVPKVNLKIKYVDLAKTLDYEATQAIEEVNVCDWVTIYFEEYGIKTNEKIIKTVWDDLLQQYDSIEVGEARASLAQSINTTVDGKLETVAVNLNTIRLAADGKTKIYTGVAEPIASNINDLWYKPVESGAVEMYRWDGIIWALQKTSADALAGTVDFATVQAINIDANAISTGTLSGANFWLNLITGIMQFTNPVTGDILVFDQGEIYYQNGTKVRRLRYSEEGFIFEPGEGNTGTSLNTSLILRGGFGSDKYIDFMDKDFETGTLSNHQRITARNAIMYFQTIDRVHVVHDSDLSFAPIAASAFEVGSSEDFKQNIMSTEISALDKISSLAVVEYDLNYNVESGIENKQLGFIAENSPYISGSGGKSIDLYKAIALTTKGVQELLARIEALETENAMMKTDIATIKKSLGLA